MSGYGIGVRLECNKKAQHSTDGEWGIGRAGMQYRDLLPDRLGGQLIASHIRIPDGGPVPDYVHHHDVKFQMIYCFRGWVKVVYEDQGPPFSLEAGDCVLQPPNIRHRVLECSDQMEVIEVSSPAEHVTNVEHDMELPTVNIDANRNFGGQRFVRHQSSNAKWTVGPYDGFEARDTGIGDATKGLASVLVIRPNTSPSPHVVDCKPGMVFTFVLQGSMTAHLENLSPQVFAVGDSFLTSPDLPAKIADHSDDLEILHVALNQ